MKKFEWFCNLIFYNLYRWDIVSNSFIEYFISFKWLKYISSNSRKNYDDRFRIVKTSSHLSIIFARNGFTLLSIIVLFSIFNLFQILTGISYNHYIYENILYLVILLISLITLSVWLNQTLLLNNKKYLVFFDKFDALPNKKRFKYGWLCFMTIISILGLFLVTLFFQLVIS